MPRLALLAFVTTAVSISFIWLVAVYDTGLRNPRYLDGWLLFGFMFMQLVFHFRRKRRQWSLGTATLWMRAHIYFGFFSVALFILHSDASLPDSLFEWMIWSAFVLVVLSGIVGVYLSIFIPRMLDKETGAVSFDGIPALRAQLALEANGLARAALSETGSKAVSEVYAETLFYYFAAPANLLAHLGNSRLPLKAMLGKIDSMTHFLDETGQERLHSLRGMVIKKDKLDHQFALQGMLKAWLFVHVPATYALVIFTILHVIVVHAFSSGAG